jgi:type I restriction enzyme S subunit
VSSELGTRSLAQICSLVTDGTHDTPKTYSTGVPLIKGKDISKGYVDFTTCDHVSAEVHQQIVKRSKPERGDTLFANIGNSLGDVAYIDTDREFSIKNVALFKPNPDVIEGRYLYYLLKSPSVQGLLLSQRAGAAQPFLGLAALRSFQIQYHSSLQSQRRIASILGAYDDLIEVNRRRIAVLEEMARGLFEQWFVRFRFPGHEAVPILDTPDGPLPEGWTWGAFRDLAGEVRETVSPGDVPPDTPYVGLEHMPRRSFTLDQHGQAEEVSSLKSRFQRSDILFGKIRPYFHKVVWAGFDGVSSTDAIVWRPVAGLAAQALATASSDAFVAYSVQTSNGTKMPRASTRVLADYRCALVSSDISSRFENTVGPMVELCATLQAGSRRLATSRDLLLPRLISGQLSVAEAERELEVAA